MGCLRLGSAGQRLVQRVGAREFWERVPAWRRPLAIAGERLAWLGACPVKAAWESGKDYARFSDVCAALWAGWALGKRPRETVLLRAMARGDRALLRLARNIPDSRQGMLALRAVGDKQDWALAADKLAMSLELIKLGLPVPAIRAVVAAGQTLRATGHPWSGPEKLMVKPVHGSQATGMFSITPLGEERFLLNGEASVDRAELERRLTLAARRDSLLVQSYVEPSADVVDLSPGAAAVVRVSVMRAAPGENASLLSAILKIPPAGTDAPAGTHDLLRIPISIEDGLLEDGVILDRPAERWSRVPWNGAPVRGRTLALWPEIVDMAIHASEILQGVPIIGWDILPGPKGPVILEANTGIGLFKEMLWHFEHGLPSPLLPVIEDWCRAHERSLR